ncbi:Rv2578c family radical SAM protein [Sinomonas sp. ASV486]|uniref:Rv2578c family radical SAM protein n=1 Tax=Sinomonas sp. ASV486 TaxID=3051170 RepID=UPI0027DD32C0|nr:Rv2578c family radical SAM protein [Sinomonas sp. ASV486]MDQ4492176.1 Rv2578c family radical SAM protein [Sinomonas sp. ASV486]
MRWNTQTVAEPLPGSDSGLPAQPPLLSLAGALRTVRTPEFQGITFHEVAAKSALNKVPPASSMPFRWTVNPYRGCSHACVYCFARNTHTYLDLDAGLDFDRQLVVKVNVAEVLRAEVSKPSWDREHVALGTNTDPYQRAEGRYALMPGIIRALAGSGTPFSILTKGTLLARDIPLLKAAGANVPIGAGISLAVLDPELQAAIEPGTPSPAARLTLISRLREAGLPCGVMVMPILPWLTDSEEHLDALMGKLAAAGATGVTTGALHLRPGTRDWFMGWLARTNPHLVGRYRSLYAKGAYAPAEYRSWLGKRVAAAKARHGFGRGFERDEAFGHRDATAHAERPLSGEGAHRGGGHARRGGSENPRHQESPPLQDALF